MAGKRLFGLLFVLGTVLYACGSACALTVEEEIAGLKARIEQLEARISRQDAVPADREELEDSLRMIQEAFDGLTIGAGATFIVQGTSHANGDDLSANGEDVIDASYSVDLELEKAFDDYATAFVHLETGDGAGVEDELKVFSGVNRDADDSDNSVSLTEVWYEQYLKSVPVTLTFGKLDPTAYIDTNEYANDECTQFLGRIFRNSPVIEFPDNSGGLRLSVAPAEAVDLEVIALDADSDWEDVFDGMFIAGQVNIKPDILGHAGNYRLVAWYSDREHTEWMDMADTTKSAYGAGISVDQELTDVLGIFARYGWQDPDVFLNGDAFSLEQAWSIGMQCSGQLWGRDEDVAGVGFGQVIPSDEYKKANNLRADSEEHIELYYAYKVNGHLTLTPDLQIILDPYGNDAANGDKTIVVGGMRGQVDF
ncbi:MAG: carbohydrate porin [Candidatus Omnitrophica bacterium]|nr:carbohydrate porin [Candidatus Omnitrophota bacterium]